MYSVIEFLLQAIPRDTSGDPGSGARLETNARSVLATLPVSGDAPRTIVPSIREE